MSPVEYAKAYLASRHQDLCQRLSSTALSRRDGKAQLSTNSMEQALECGNDSVLDPLAKATRLEIAQVRHAINRIYSNRYGICEGCGLPINRVRLRAVPEAMLCSSCAMAPLTTMAA